MIKRGVKFTITDDSHSPIMVAYKYRPLRSYVQKSGLTHLYKLDRPEGAAPGPAGTKIVAVPLDEALWDHPAWRPAAE